jgi:Glycosyl hydrolase family 12
MGLPDPGSGKMMDSPETSEARFAPCGMVRRQPVFLPERMAGVDRFWGLSEDKMHMRHMRIVWPLLVVALFLNACGSGQPSKSTPTDAAGAVAMDCDDGALINSGEYRAENNTWGKGALTGWSQCIGIGVAPDGTLFGHWTWDWLNSGSNIKAYPEVIFGQKPGTTATSTALPIKIDDIGAATVSYDISSKNTGSGNAAFDLWLTDSPNPSTWGVPPITREIMIWIDRFGAMAPGGAFLGRASIDGPTYVVYYAKHWGDGWDYIAFMSAESQLGAGNLDLGSFFAYLRGKNLVTGDEYLASVEFGNEIVSGAGETVMERYAVSIQKK